MVIGKCNKSHACRTDCGQDSGFPFVAQGIENKQYPVVERNAAFVQKITLAA
jgi:hypothetical protein